MINSGCFSSSFLSEKLMIKLETVARTGYAHLRKNECTLPDEILDGPGNIVIQEYDRFVDHGLGKTSFFRQYYTLVMRDITVALRDPALYYLQFILVLFFGFLVGAVFTNTKFVVDSNLYSKSGGLLWIVYMMAYIQICKVTLNSATLWAMILLT